ncbi:unnamed protein product [Parnassius mnemosyne]
MFQPLNKNRRLFEWAIPKLKLRLIFAEDSIEPLAPGYSNQKCNPPKELNVLELSDHLNSPDERTDEPLLKYIRLNIHQNEKESQKP